jgi:hypothetical protein
MNTLLEAPADEGEAVDLRHDAAGVVRKANGSPPSQGRSESRWLKATIRAIDSRRDALERMHWKKVWRSMVED